MAEDLLSSGDGKVETGLDGGVDGIIERLSLASAKRHVGDRSLVLGLASSGELLLSVGLGLGSLLSSPPVAQCQSLALMSC